MQTILIVDDVVDIAEACALVLREAGFTCLLAYDLATALDVFDALAPSLVLADICLADRDGFAIALHVSSKSPQTPVVLMTAHLGPEVTEQATRIGVDGLLRKPFSNAELVNTVKALLARAERGPWSTGLASGFRAC